MKKMMRQWERGRISRNRDSARVKKDESLFRDDEVPFLLFIVLDGDRQTRQTVFMENIVGFQKKIR